MPVRHADLPHFLMSFACAADPELEPVYWLCFHCLNRKGGNMVKEEVVVWSNGNTGDTGADREPVLKF